MSQRHCHDCGAQNLADAEYCATCGIAIETAGGDRPWLARLVDADGPAATPAERPEPTATEATPAEATPAEPTAVVATPAEPTPAVAAAVPQVATSRTPTRPAKHAPPLPVAPPARAWLAPAIAVVVVITLAATLLALLAGNRSTGDSTETPVEPTVDSSSAPTTDGEPAAAATITPDPAASATTTSAAVPTTTPSPADATAELASIADTDRDRIMALQGRWVPQLSAKQDGTEWEGVVYDLPAILDLHRRLGEQVGETLLVEGSTLAFLIDGERMSGWWITLADHDFDDAASALDWCNDAGFDRANCAARLLTDDDTVTGTLRLQTT